MRQTLILALLVGASAIPCAMQAAERPALVVAVSIDQFPYEYLERMSAQFASDGMFRRLLDDGAMFTQCHHGHAFTYTAPGHSVQLTGAFPNSTGIVDNEWFDRTSGKKMYCVADEETELVGAVGKGMSPKNLQTATLGDVMKLTWPESRVFGVSLKDRAAILMTGHLADGAYWYHPESGNWVTSTYYRQDMPSYLRIYNESLAVEAFLGHSWQLLLPKDRYVEHHVGEAKPPATGAPLRIFPHKLPDRVDRAYYDAVTKTPWGNDVTLDVAKLVILGSNLGKGPTPDMLCVNLSSNDYIGHAFGPHSLEVQDTTYRTDRQLGEFAKFIEEHLEGRPWVFALSSDHGVGPVPEYAKKRGLPAGRDPLGNLNTYRDQLEAKLQLTLGKAEGRYIQSLDYCDVYLDRELPQLKGERFHEAQRVLRDALLEHAAIAVAFTRDEIIAGGAAEGLPLQFHRTFNAQRSGDVLFALKPYWIAGGAAATHGSPWKYDSHVPLAFWGPMIKPGHYSRPVAPAAMGPTLARVLQLESPPSAVVEPLIEIIRPSAEKRQVQ